MVLNNQLETFLHEATFFKEELATIKEEVTHNTFQTKCKNVGTELTI